MNIQLWVLFHVLAFHISGICTSTFTRKAINTWASYEHHGAGNAVLRLARM
jgi:hypothetical protein